MRTQLVTWFGKGVARAARLKGGGSALPGLVVERIDRGYMARMLSKLPHGVVIISGTNGKTTTTKMVVELLESQGLTVFTNRTGSNFTRGVVAALLDAADRSGKLVADIAVLELDEAHAVHFTARVKPSYALLLNVMRDQLDRFGEIDTTATMLQTIATRTTKGVVVNRDDPRLGSSDFLAHLTAPKRTYGVSAELRSRFPSDDQLHGQQTASEPIMIDDTVLLSIDDDRAEIGYDDKHYTLTLKVKGIYNLQNAVGALALTRMIAGEALDEPSLLAALSAVTPAFGRGETIVIDGRDCELVLVKNPAGFRLGLASFDPANTATMIAINDDYADGRDMSWLWDVDFGSLQETDVAMVSGVRAYDMALRLRYDEVKYSVVEPGIEAALAQFIAASDSRPMRIYCTYTAMLHLRRLLSRKGTVEKIL